MPIYRRLLLGALALLFSLPGFAVPIVFSGQILEINGPDDLELSPDSVVHAIDLFGDQDRIVNGVLFKTDRSPIPGVFITASESIDGWAPRPIFSGANLSSVNNFERIMQDIRWEHSPFSLRVDISGLTSGVEYRLQLLFNEGSNQNRRFDIGLEGQLAVDDFSSEGEGVWAIDNSFVYQVNVTLDPGDTTLNIVLDNNIGGQGPNGSDQNPILQALVLSDIFINSTPTALTLERNGFFASQSAAIGRFTTVDEGSQNHLYALVEGFGDHDKFLVDDDELTLNPSYDFTQDALGTTYSVRIRTADAAAPNRFLEEDFTLTLQSPLAPSGLTFSTSSIGEDISIGAVTGEFSTIDPNFSDDHRYELITGPGSTHNSLFTISGNQLLLTQSIPASLELLSFRCRATDFTDLFVEQTFTLSVTESSFRLNEVMISNATGLQDEDDSTSDWVELLNLQSGISNLIGWYLTDDEDELTKWQFPSTLVAAESYLVVFLSGKDRATEGSELHTNFAISSTGGSLFLVRPDGITIADELIIPESYPDVSYGRNAAGDSLGFLQSATPNGINGATAANVVNSVAFSVPRGIYSSNFDLTLTAAIAGSTIRYTTNGEAPTPSNSSIYTGPINISPETSAARTGTRRIRAIALSPNASVSPIETHTYVWLSNVLNQSVFQTSITSDPAYGPIMLEGLGDLPIVSVTKPNGIGATEENTSIELLSNDGSETGFQIDCGIKIVGGDSVRSAKNNFRLYFRGIYGAGKLRYPLFDNHPYTRGASDEFDVLQLRSGSHDSFFWMAEPRFPLWENLPGSPLYRRADAQYVRNRWVSDVEMLMGHESLHGRFVHCYLNGSYHGLYHLHERPMHSFMDKYFGGDSDDYHFTNSATSGSEHGGGDGWQTTWGQVRAAATIGGQLSQNWINWKSLADNQLLHYYCGNDWDWKPQQNWMAAGPQVPGNGGWRFFNWDSDVILNDVTSNNLEKDAPDGVFLRLMNDEDFRVYFRDRVYKHCFHDGLLAAGNLQPSYDYRMNEIFKAIVPETARWQPREEADLPNPPWDRDQEWTTEWDYLRNTYWPERTAILLDQFRDRGWYPVEAPEFTLRGGAVTAGYAPTILGNSGNVYFTTDGSDPRLPGGGTSPSAQNFGPTTSTTIIAKESSWKYLDDGSNQGSAWRLLDFNDSSWSSGNAELGYGDGGENTVVSFGPTASDKYITTYFRKSFTLAEASGISGLSMELRRDDGAIVYLNGTEVWRNNMPAEATFETPARDTIGEEDESRFLLKTDISPFLLQTGTNTIAVEIHQATPNSTDLSFDLELAIIRPAGINPFSISESIQINARRFDGSDWSPLNVTRFTVGDPADETNLVISEFSYRPAKASAAEDPGDLYSRTDFEFIELTNITSSPIHLDGARFVDGISFDFTNAVNFSIPAGESRLLVENREAFLARYPATDLSHIIGEYDGNLSNDGERLALITADNFVIRDFTYNDKAPWPEAADGDGYSLELIDHVTSPDHTIAQNWRSSRGIHGSPDGLFPRLTFAEWQAANFSSQEAAISTANADPDGDGWTNYAEFALGSSPREYENRIELPAASFIEIAGENYLALTYREWAGARNVTYQVEVSDDLREWEDSLMSITEVGSPINFDDGTTEKSIRSVSPVSAISHQFIRLRFRSE